MFGEEYKRFLKQHRGLTSIGTSYNKPYWDRFESDKLTWDHITCLGADFFEDLKLWKNITRAEIKEQYETIRECEYESITYSKYERPTKRRRQPAGGTDALKADEALYDVKMLQYKSRIRRYTVISINMKDGEVHAARVFPRSKKCYGIQDKTACIAFKKVELKNIKSIHICRKFEHDTKAEFDQFAERINIDPEVELKNQWINYLLNKEVEIPKSNPVDHRYFNKESKIFLKLNEEQKKAVEICFGESGIVFIQGPPGTGKTTTLASVAALYAQQGIGVICTTESNAGCRRMAECLAKHLKPSEFQLKVGWEFWTWHCVVYDELLKKEVTGRTITREAAVLCLTMASIFQSLQKYIKFKSHNFFTKVDKVVSMRRTVLIIEEASQIWEYKAILLLRLFANFQKVIIFGDQWQLPPHGLNADDTVDSDDIMSLIDRVTEKGKNAPPTMMLKKQYRMAYEIGELVSKLFYDHQLQHHKTKDGKKHILFHNSGGIAVEKGTSFYNEQEAKDVIELYNDMSTNRMEGVETHDIVVLTFYEAQRFLINKFDPSIRAFNVDGFQGQEASTVIVSTVGRKKVSGFLGDKRRVNVALSRAKDKLVIVGDRNTLERHATWRRIWND